MDASADVVRAVVSFFGVTNRLVRAQWPLFVGAVLAVVGALSGYKFYRDQEVRPDHDVSTAPLDGTERVSVLLPAWNEGPIVERAIEAFQGLSYPNRELLVCAGGSDGTYERALRAADAERTRVVEQTSDMNKQAALNACLEEARGDVLYLVDGDCVLDDETWNAALRPVVEGDETVVAGTSRPLDEQWGRLLPTYQHVKEEYERARRPRYVRGLLGRNAVVSRAAMDELGAFDESIRAGTDYNLAKRLLDAGHEIRFVPNSRVRTRYPTSVGTYFAQQSRWLRNVFFLGRRWGEAAEARTTLVTCTVGAGMLLVPLVGVAWLPLLLAWLGLVGYGVSARFRWVLFFGSTHARPVPFAVAVASVGLMFVEFAAWTYAGIELALPHRRRKW